MPATFDENDLYAARVLLAEALGDDASRWRSGTLSPAERRAVVRRLVETSEAKLKAHGDRLAADLRPRMVALGLTSTLTAWRDSMARFLRQLHLAGALALLGPDMDTADHEAIRQANEVQRGYLDGFVRDVASGKQATDGTLGSRAAMYGRSLSAVTQAVGRERAGRDGSTEERRIHEGDDVPCDECQEQLDLGWQPHGTLRPIGDCECKSGCHCSWQFRDESTVALSRERRATVPSDNDEFEYIWIDDEDVPAFLAQLRSEGKSMTQLRSKVTPVALVEPPPTLAELQARHAQLLAEREALLARPPMHVALSHEDVERAERDRIFIAAAADPTLDLLGQLRQLRHRQDAARAARRTDELLGLTQGGRDAIALRESLATTAAFAEPLDDRTRELLSYGMSPIELMALNAPVRPVDTGLDDRTRELLGHTGGGRELIAERADSVMLAARDAAAGPDGISPERLKALLACTQGGLDTMRQILPPGQCPVMPS